MAHVIISHNGSVRRAARPVSLAVTAAYLVLNWARRIRNRRELMRLLSQPDYLIKDVGLQRDLITREALKPFWVE